MIRAGSFGRRRIAKRSAWHRSARTLASDENAIADPWLVTAEAISEPPIDDAFAGVTRRAVRSVSSGDWHPNDRCDHQSHDRATVWLTFDVQTKADRRDRSERESAERSEARSQRRPTSPCGHRDHQ